MGSPYLYAPQRVLRTLDFLETALAALGWVATGPIVISGKSGWILPGGHQYLEAVLLLSRLPAEEAEVLVLCSGHFLKIAEIAEVLDIPVEKADELLTQGALSFYEMKWGHGDSRQGNRLHQAFG